MNLDTPSVLTLSLLWMVRDGAAEYRKALELMKRVDDTRIFGIDLSRVGWDLEWGMEWDG